MEQKKKYRKRSVSKGDANVIHEIVVAKVLEVEGLDVQRIPDIEHDLIVILARKLRQFDPAIKSWAAFRAVVVYHALTDIVRRHTGPLSDYNCMADFSLDDPVPGKRHDPVFYRDLVNSDGVLADGTEKNESELWNLQLDVREVVAQLPDELRITCEMILTHGCKSKTDISRELGVSLSTIFRRFREIKKVFVEHGFPG